MYMLGAWIGVDMSRIDQGSLKRSFRFKLHNRNVCYRRTKVVSQHFMPILGAFWFIYICPEAENKRLDKHGGSLSSEMWFVNSGDGNATTRRVVFIFFFLICLQTYCIVTVKFLSCVRFRWKGHSLSMDFFFSNIYVFCNKPCSFYYYNKKETFSAITCVCRRAS